MQTVAVFIQSVILQAFGTESGSFMRESPEAGDPWIKGTSTGMLTFLGKTSMAGVSVMLSP